MPYVHITNIVGWVSTRMLFRQESLAQTHSESLANSRSTRRQRKLDLIEIPEEHLAITDELLGRGGFGEVYLADYNGRNAAAKVNHAINCMVGGFELAHSN